MTRMSKGQDDIVVDCVIKNVGTAQPGQDPGFSLRQWVGIIGIWKPQVLEMAGAHQLSMSDEARSRRVVMCLSGGQFNGSSRLVFLCVTSMWQAILVSMMVRRPRHCFEKPDDENVAMWPMGNCSNTNRYLS